jgi:hypothetical protein
LRALQLKNYFDSELNLPLWNSRSHQGPRSRAGQGCPICSENVSISVTGAWRGKVRVIENVEHFGSELYVEIFRDSSDVVVLEYREVETHYARADQAIPACISS